MKEFKKYRYSSITVMIIVSFVFLFTKCINRGTWETTVVKNFKGQKFAGSATCASCHKNIYDSHRKTAHYLTSGKASESNIKGSFEPGKNTFNYEMGTAVTMEKRNDSFYQVEYHSGKERDAYPMDIVLGSGMRGQSYLYWMRNQLFQLPVSYFGGTNQWSNSPGFPNTVLFNRTITTRCLECHSTNAKVISPPEINPEQFDASQMIYGVDCEKCHGPAAEHVEFQTQNPTATIAKYIINPSRLSRQQNMDLCTSCHGGRLFKKRPPFEFMAGDTLLNFFDTSHITLNPNSIDVHGNQSGLLRASKCFRMSETLTCNTCHNTHENERGKTALFSQRCMSCHNEEHKSFCKFADKVGAEIKSNCIDCHMPLSASGIISVALPGDTALTAAMIRSHFITIYPDRANKVLSLMKKKH